MRHVHEKKSQRKEKRQPEYVIPPQGPIPVKPKKKIAVDTCACGEKTDGRRYRTNGRRSIDNRRGKRGKEQTNRKTE